MENANIAGMGIFAFIGLLAVTTPLLLHIVTKKYVTRVYYDAKEDKYIANTYSLFVRKKEVFIYKFYIIASWVMTFFPLNNI